MIPCSVPAMTPSGFPGCAENESIPSNSFPVREGLHELPPFVDFSMLPDVVPYSIIPSLPTKSRVARGPVPGMSGVSASHVLPPFVEPMIPYGGTAANIRSGFERSMPTSYTSAPARLRSADVLISIHVFPLSGDLKSPFPSVPA